MKKIGLLIDSLIGGGAERVVLNFAQSFAANGHDVHIILIKDLIQHDIKNLRIKVHAISKDGIFFKSRFLNKLTLANKLKALIKEIESDGIKFNFFISNDENMDRLSSKAKLSNVYIRYRNSMLEFIATKIGKKKGLKAAVREFRWNLKFRRIYDNRNIITICEAQKKEILDIVKIKPKSITTINNPFLFKDLIKKSREPANLPIKPYIIYVARFNPRKRQDVLINAFIKSNISHDLVLIGDLYSETDKKYFDSLLKLIKKENIENRVIFPGFQKNPYPWIKGANLFVMSSDSEGLPTVLIESLILGTRVVSTDCPTGPSEILTGVFSKFLSPVGNPDALAINIEKALISYPLITNKLLERFEADKVVKKYLSWCSS